MAETDITILICTRNRDRLLGETLDSVAQLLVPPLWKCEVLVVDNGSTDNTRAVVSTRIPDYPLSLRYLYEPTPGKSTALNSGIAATNSTVLACADDDVRVVTDWLKAGCEPLLDSSARIAYTGGPVRPIWERPCPDWFPREPSDLWGTIAILDYGKRPFVFEEERKVPLGANIAFRRDMIERLGGFIPALGRSTTRTLLGQELPELLRRAAAAGIRGLYVPEMEVFHHIPAARLTAAYYRRWWFGKGVSRARVDRIHPVTELGIDLRSTPHILGIPRFMIGSAWRHVWHWAGAAIRLNVAERIRLETRLCYFAGYVWETRRDRRHALAAPTPPVILPAGRQGATPESGSSPGPASGVHS